LITGEGPGSSRGPGRTRCRSVGEEGKKGKPTWTERQITVYDRKRHERVDGKRTLSTGKKKKKKNGRDEELVLYQRKLRHRKVILL